MGLDNLAVLRTKTATRWQVSEGSLASNWIWVRTHLPAGEIRNAARDRGGVIPMPTRRYGTAKIDVTAERQTSSSVIGAIAAVSTASRQRAGANIPAEDVFGRASQNRAEPASSQLEKRISMLLHGAVIDLVAHSRLRQFPPSADEYPSARQARAAWGHIHSISEAP